MSTLLEVQSDGKIYVVKDCPDQHFAKGCHTELHCESESLAFAEQFCGCYNRYQQELASCERILCADQEQAKRLIKQEYGHDIDEMNIKTTGYQYQVPVEWEYGQEATYGTGGVTGFKVVAILKDSNRQSEDIDVTQKESQEELKPIRCPFCDARNSLTLEQVTETKIKGSRVVKGIFDVWKCSDCGEGFTKHWQIIPIDTDNA